jgi:hypothetical protein
MCFFNWIRNSFKSAFLVAVSSIFIASFAQAAFITFTNESNWQSAAGLTALEDFQSYSAGTQITMLPNLGISFDVLAGGGHPQTYNFGGTPHGSMQLGNFPNGINQTNRYDDIVLRSMTGYQMFGLGYWNGDGQNSTFVANAYDSSGNLLGSVGAGKGQFAGFTSGTAISRVVFVGNSPGTDGWNHLDGLQTAVVIPEPSTALLLGMGLVSIAATRQRSR